MTSIQQSANKTLPGIIAIMLIIPALFYQTTMSMAEVWISNETFTHGFLVLPISLWLMWQKKTEINKKIATPEPRLLILLIPILGIWLVSKIVDVQVVQQLMMVSIIPVIVWLIFGRKILIILLFPLLYLYFAVPIGQSLIPSMMEFTANFTVRLISLTGIPIYREGLFFSLPSGNWSVVEECSGVRYIIASLALGTIYAYINYESTRKRMIFMFFALLVPILANGFRAFGIVMIGHFSGMELAVGADHLLYGWVFFGIVIFMMFYIGSYWWDPLTKGNDQINPTTEASSADTKRISILAAIAVTSILAIELFATQVQNKSNMDTHEIDLSIPTYFEGWQHNTSLSLNWKPIINNPDANISRSYQFGEDLVQLDIGYFVTQREGAEAITSLNKLTDPYDGEWKIIQSADLKEEHIFVTESVLQRRGQKLLVWNWYRVGAQQTPNPYIAKATEAYNQIILGRNDAAVFTLSTVLSGVAEDARLKLRDFWSTASNDILSNLETIPVPD